MNSEITNALMRVFHMGINRNVTHTTGCDAYPLLKRGLVFVNEEGQTVRYVDPEVAYCAQDQFGLYNNLWSETFHKSLEKVATASMDQLVAEQLMHYFSTYGLESMGYRAMPRVPVEALNLDLDEDANGDAFTVIRVVSEETAKQAIVDYLKVTERPNKQLIDEIRVLMSMVDVKPEDIVSFELKAIQYDRLGLVPVDGVEFLRFLIYKATGETLVIKNHATIAAIQIRAKHDKYFLGHSNSTSVDYSKYFARANLATLAQNFYRFKPLWLAFKAFSGCAPYINRMRRLAVENHKPLSDVNVQNFSKLYYEGRMDDARKVLHGATTRQLVKLLDFARMIEDSVDVDCNSSVYNIRNGKTHVDVDHHFANNNAGFYMADMVITELMKRFSDTLTGKTFVIPSYIDYTVPYSEKQFVDTMPYGTVLHCPEDKAFTVAIAWDNYRGQRTDLDLHMTSESGEGYGWNSSYRSVMGEDDVLYSGDMTDATNGAAEAFYFKPQCGQRYIVSAANYTREDGVPFKLLITDKQFEQREPQNWWEEAYDFRSQTPPVDVADAILPPLNLKFKGANTTQMNLGMFAGSSDFIFYGGEMGNRIVPDRALLAQATKALNIKLSSMMTMREFLEIMGANVVDEAPATGDYIDLSPANLTARTLLDIVDQKK